MQCGVNKNVINLKFVYSKYINVIIDGKYYFSDIDFS